MDAPTVSVIIPVYNSFSTLARCLDSVLNQSFSNVEIIVVDDGSPDEAGVLADGYAARHENVKVIHTVNRGAAEARRRGFETAQGVYIMPVDSDDDLPQGAIDTLYRHCEAEHLDLVYGAYRRFVGNENFVMRHKMTGIFDSKQFLHHLFDPDCICGACYCMIRREVCLHDIFPPSGEQIPSEDLLINIKMSAFVNRVGLYNDVVYNYYMNPNSQSIGGALHKQDLWKRHFELIRENLESRECLNELEPQLRCMEIDRLAFFVEHVDRHDDWLQQVEHYDMSKGSRRVKVLQFLLRHNILRRTLIKFNKRVKRTLHIK